MKLIVNEIIGKRIRLIHTTDEYTRLQYGDLGTVKFIDDTGTIFCDWDNGSRLGMIPGVDKYQILQD